MSSRNIVSSESKWIGSTANKMRPGPVGQTLILRSTTSKADVTKANKPQKGSVLSKPRRLSRHTSMSATIEAEEPTRRKKRGQQSETVKLRGKVKNVTNDMNEDNQEVSAGPVRGAELVGK